MRPLISAFCDGEAGAEEAAELREHLRACAHCRATVRTYRAAPAAAGALAPALPLHRSLLGRAHDALDDVVARLGARGRSRHPGRLRRRGERRRRGDPGQGRRRLHRHRRWRCGLRRRGSRAPAAGGGGRALAAAAPRATGSGARTSHGGSGRLRTGAPRGTAAAAAPRCGGRTRALGGRTGSRIQRTGRQRRRRRIRRLRRNRPPLPNRPRRKTAAAIPPGSSGREPPAWRLCQPLLRKSALGVEIAPRARRCVSPPDACQGGRTAADDQRQGRRRRSKLARRATPSAWNGIRRRRRRFTPGQSATASGTRKGTAPWARFATRKSWTQSTR